LASQEELWSILLIFIFRHRWCKNINCCCV